jgi:hypothetical protein
MGAISIPLVSFFLEFILCGFFFFSSNYVPYAPLFPTDSLLPLSYDSFLLVATKEL